MSLPVIQQSLPSAFAAEAAFLVAAERRRRIELVEGVRPDDAGLELACSSSECASPCPSTRRRDRPYAVLFAFSTASSSGAESQHAQHRAEDFLPRDAMALRDAREDASA